MMSSMNNRRLVDSFKWGFLADRVYEILSLFQKEGTLYDEDEHILESAHEMLMKILDGDEQATSGKFAMNSLDELKLYNRSIEIINTRDFIKVLTQSDDPKIHSVIELIDNSIQHAKKHKKTDGLKTSIKFFDLLRDLTLNESNNILRGVYENRGLRRWSSTR